MTSRRILYISNVWTSLQDVLYEEAEEIKGMPAFWRPLKKLINNGYHVDIIFYDYNPTNKGKQYKVKLDWFRQINIIHHIYLVNTDGFLKLASNLLNIVKLRSYFSRFDFSKYNLVYGHGPMSDIANYFCQEQRIPFGMRRYGDSLTWLIKQKGKLYSMLSRPVDYFSYRTQKQFMVATNDGSKIDELYRLINKGEEPFPLYFWVNGVDIPDDVQTVVTNSMPPNNSYLLYTARIIRSKRQDRAIELIRLLKIRGVEIDLFFAGSIDDSSFYNELVTTINIDDSQNHVHFLGNQDAARLFFLAQNALACLTFYDDTNFGNSFIEYMKAGACVIGMNDGSLDKTIEHGKNGFLVNDMSEAADCVIHLKNDNTLSEIIKLQARITADERFLSWPDRIDLEMSLLEEFI